MVHPRGHNPWPLPALGSLNGQSQFSGFSAAVLDTTVVYFNLGNIISELLIDARQIYLLKSTIILEMYADTTGRGSYQDSNAHVRNNKLSPNDD